MISSNTNGILTLDAIDVMDYPYVMNGIYFEADIDNLFFREKSEF